MPPSGAAFAPFVSDTEIAASLACIAPSRWVGCLIRDVRHGEGPAIHGGNVAARAREDHRMVWCHHIPVVTGRIARAAYAGVQSEGGSIQ